MRRLSLFLPLLALMATAPVGAKVPWVKKAQKAGFSQIQNCQSCHANATPDAKGEPLHEAGKFLMDKKKATNAKEVDLAWLKEYYEKKK